MVNHCAAQAAQARVRQLPLKDPHSSLEGLGAGRDLCLDHIFVSLGECPAALIIVEAECL